MGSTVWVSVIWNYVFDFYSGSQYRKGFWFPERSHFDSVLVLATVNDIVLHDFYSYLQIYTDLIV